MEGINLALAQRASEIEFILKKTNKKLTWIPLNLETLLFLKQKKLNYISIENIINKEFHQDGLSTVENLVDQIKKDTQLDFFLKKRYLGIVRKYLNSIFLIIKIIDEIEKKNNISCIYLSGWNRVNFQDSSITRKNFIVSSLVYEIFKEKYKIKLLSESKEDSQRTASMMILPENLNYNYIMINNVGYKFIRIIISNFFSKTKFLAIDTGSINIFKKIILHILGVRFIKKKLYNIEINKKLIFSKIKLKLENHDLTKVLSNISNSIEYELNYLLNQKKFFQNLFNLKRPKKIIFNNSHGINEFISEYSKKLDIPCYMISHGTLAENENKYSNMYNSIIAEEVTSKYATNCVQSKIALYYFKKNYKKEEYKITGNLIFASSKSKSKKYFMYAVTTRDFMNMQFYGIELFNEFYNNLKDLNNIAKELKISICVKPHPQIQNQTKNLQKEFSHLNFSNKSIDLLLKDSIATISFSSTVIEDSLNSSIPVILYDKSGRYNHCENFNLKKNSNQSVMYVNNLSDLKEKIISCYNLKSSFSEFTYEKKESLDFLYK